ncbi:putative VP3 [Microviridae sp.]|nr:putative VP3 [Microviridae sp.]
MPKIYSRFDLPVVDGKRFPGKTRTQQQYKEECDINTLMARYRDQGILPRGRAVQYGDFSTLESYQEAQNLLVQAREQFDSLPSEQRARFKNDPALFLEFVTDKGNVAAMRELGMLSPEAVARLDREEAAAKAALEAAQRAALAAAAPAK